MVEGFVHQNGFNVDYFEVVGSTNDLAMERVRSGGSGSHWIVAGEQNKGRGRHGRVWTSPPGNLYASLTLMNPCSAATGFQLGFVAALSIYDAVAASGVDRSLLGLKWPNDVLANGAKLSGILIEGTLLSDGSFAVVIGCGINVSHHPSDTPYPATDLRSLGIDTSAEIVFGSLTAAFKNWLDVYENGTQFPKIRAAWIERSMGMNAPVEIKNNGIARRGIFSGLDENGCLLLDQDGQIVRIEAGDVFPAGR